MTRVLSVLVDFLREIEKDNPYGLVLKGGTALSLFYLNHHRESEDLDFDSDISNVKRYKAIEKYFIGILERVNYSGPRFARPGALRRDAYAA